MKIMTDHPKVPVRMLTPRECLRLMGFHDDEIDRISDEFPKTRLYAFAGDAIVVDVLEGIIGNLFVPPASEQKRIEDF